jgi:uncharacterized membrane protein YuzA (DUF378 family)
MVITAQALRPQPSRVVFNGLDWVAWALAVIGALNWGLVGAFNFDLVAAILGTMTMPARVVYILVGVAGLYCLSIPFRLHGAAHTAATRV